MDVAADDLRDDVLYQLGALQAFAHAAGTRISHLKPHGALYHAVVTHQEQAAAVVAAVAEYDSGLAVLGLPGSALLELAAAAGLRAVPEAFADRRYTADGGLLARSQPGSVLTDPAAVAEQVRRLVTEQAVLTADGTVRSVTAESICVHGDTPGAVRIAQQIRATIEQAGVSVRPFAS